MVAARSMPPSAKRLVGGAVDREELLEGIHRLDPWFHRIELAPGVLTKTESVAGEPADHPRETWDIVKNCLPADLSGKSVLDVGCNAGFYSVEAKRRNASHVVGVDAMRREIMQAEFVRRALGLDIEFRALSVYDLGVTSVGRFDVTLALGLIYHLKHLVLGLEKLAQVTKDTLIVETALLPKRPKVLGSASRQAEYVVGGLKRPLHTIGWIENPPEAAESAYNWFLPSLDGAVALLRAVGFRNVEVFAVQGDRAVIVCRDPDATVEGGAAGALSANLQLVDGPTTCRPGDRLTYRVDVRNQGSASWQARPERGSDAGVVRLGAHLLPPDEGDLPVWDYGRGDLESDVPPGGEASIDIVLRAPERPGAYQVEFDMVAEQVAWFEDRGSPVIRGDLRVDAH
jgi:tRNA (mo5U34)-methyltransferase